MSRCSLCPGVNKCVQGSGPVPCDLVFIGEAPGRDEDAKGEVFIGKTGREVNEHYLPLAGLRRSNVRIINAIKCLPNTPKGKLDMNKQDHLELLMTCAEHSLYPELHSCHPKVIVPMGAFACFAIDPDINLELQHGIPLETMWGTVFPMYHPAGGIHEPKKMLLIRNDWVRLGKFLKGKLKPHVDEYPDPDYREWRDGRLQHPLAMPGDVMACDTESTRQHKPFCLTFTYTPGMARLIKADDKIALETFQELFLDQWTGPILFHNWLHDRNMVQGMGLRFPEHLIVDTMGRAYHLGNLPQGLKALAYRDLGMKMEDFDDLVTPYSIPLCLAYLREAYDKEWPKPEETLRRNEMGQLKLYKPQSVSTKLKRFLSDYRANPTKDIFKAWDNWEDQHQLIEEVMGRPWPGKCITYAPFDRVVHYACRDADATLRLWYVLQGMTRNVRRKLQEHWSD